MKRIGILTYHRSVNYGAFMQAFALSRRLSELDDVSVEIIDYMSKRMDRYYKLFTLYRGKSGLFQIGKRLAMYRAFQNSMSKLPLSKQSLVTDDQEKFFASIKDRYDIIVVGSDAVWNYEKRGLPNPYFLIDETNAIKVSYAASCNGIDYNQLDEGKLVILKQAFSSFAYIGVRDELTKKVVEKAKSDAIIQHNCDPTFLLDFEKDGLGEDFCKQLKERLVRKYQLDPSKRLIGLMLSNMNGDLAYELVRRLKEKYGESHQIVSIYSYCQYADIPYIADLTPFEWSRIFSLFDITFSKYFHGTLLSILNQTPVVSLSAEKEFEGIPAKVEDVLRRLDLMECYFPARQKADINWNALMHHIENMITNPPKERMQAGIERERKSSEDYFLMMEEKINCK